MQQQSSGTGAMSELGYLNGLVATLNSRINLNVENSVIGPLRGCSQPLSLAHAPNLISQHDKSSSHAQAGWCPALTEGKRETAHRPESSLLVVTYTTDAGFYPLITAAAACFHTGLQLNGGASGYGAGEVLQAFTRCRLFWLWRRISLSGHPPPPSPSTAPICAIN
ncbi:hypothetical protein C2S52_010856 [Perilla frutescens var. hirtella]|nr:hypothetical protein C2S52_010856 [Perilla frutescens var. hirtella]